MKEALQNIRQSADALIAQAADAAAVDELRVRFLGKKGELTAILKQMGRLSAEERPVVGALANEVREAITADIARRTKELESAALAARLAAEEIDVTLPGKAPAQGKRHPFEQVLGELKEIFLGMGFDIVSGPEVELDHYNFEMLNMPKSHPARDTQDTFYFTENVLLRTQTSGVQVHVMEQQKPPIYIIAPGKVYRRDVADPSHLPQFTQIEGLVVDKGISFGDLKGTLDYFCKQMFGPDRKTRFRAHYFPFTEPSAEADVSCGVCGGTGHLHDGERCRMCKGTGWLEILGCGMVDPNVLSMSGIDPEEYSGFAFGVGVERVACLKYNVPDLRMLLEGDMRFLRQF